MIVTDGNRQLSLLQVDYMTDGQWEPAALVGVMIVFPTLGMASLARGIGSRFGLRTL